MTNIESIYIWWSCSWFCFLTWIYSLSKSLLNTWFCASDCARLWWHMQMECTCIHGGKSLLANKETKQIITKITITVITATKENYCKQWKPANVSRKASLKKGLLDWNLKNQLDLPKHCWWFQLSRTEESCGGWTLACEAGWCEMRLEEVTLVSYC